MKDKTTLYVISGIVVLGGIYFLTRPKAPAQPQVVFVPQQGSGTTNQGSGTQTQSQSDGGFNWGDIFDWAKEGVQIWKDWKGSGSSDSTQGNTYNSGSITGDGYTGDEYTV